MQQNGATRVALVTGAGSGIGRAVARAFLTDGYRVGLVGRRQDALVETAGDAAEALILPADVTDPAAVDQVFHQVAERWGRLDVLFNNAGVTGQSANFADTDYDDWQSVVDVNLNGALLCARAAFTMMKAQQPQGGRIINNGSLAAHTPRPHSVAYTATKHAITGLTKSIELDGRPYGIAASQIDIGNADTGLVDRLKAGGGALQGDGRRIPEPSFPVEEVGEAVLFMANRRPGTTVSSLMIMAQGMPFVGRG